MELAQQPGELAVRDSKNPDGPQLAFRSGRARAFLTAVKAGRFER